MSPETPQIEQADQSEFVIPSVPENLLPAQTETQPEAVSMIEVPKDLLSAEQLANIEARTKIGRVGMDAADVHEPIITAVEDFKGDPSRVPGHPSNPATAMLAGFSSSDNVEQ